MSNNKKSLLNENTIRRMMKLASVESLSDGFISERKYEWHKGDDSKTREGEKDDGDSFRDQGARGDTDYTGKGMRKDDDSDTDKGKKDFEKNESVNEEEEEAKLDATEDELSDMDSEADRERDELEADDAAMEDEVTLTDDEARDIIALADKLRAAMGDDEEIEGAMDAMDSAEDEMDGAMDAMDDAEDEMDVAMDLEPGSRYSSMIAEKSEELYEAALKGLDIEIVDDRAAQLENLKKSVYKKVVERLLKDTKE
jgi:hypothetical protein